MGKGSWVLLFTQTSALLPPRCIDAAPLCDNAMRASPPGSTYQDCGPFLSAKTRNINERGTTEVALADAAVLCQVGICANGIVLCMV